MSINSTYQVTQITKLSNKEYNDFMKTTYNIDVFEISNNNYLVDTQNNLIQILSIANCEDDILAAPALKRAHEITINNILKLKYSIVLNFDFKINSIMAQILNENNIDIIENN